MHDIADFFIILFIKKSLCCEHRHGRQDRHSQNFYRGSITRQSTESVPNGTVLRAPPNENEKPPLVLEVDKSERMLLMIGPFVTTVTSRLRSMKTSVGPSKSVT
jgi:hypothetical protein